MTSGLVGTILANLQYSVNEKTTMEFARHQTDIIYILLGVYPSM